MSANSMGGHYTIGGSVDAGFSSGADILTSGIEEQPRLSSADFMNFFNVRPSTTTSISDGLNLSFPFEQHVDGADNTLNVPSTIELNSSLSIQQLADAGVFKTVAAPDLQVDDSTLGANTVQRNVEFVNSLFSNEFFNYVDSMVAPSDSIEYLAEGESPTIQIQYEAMDPRKVSSPDFIVGRDGAIQMLRNPEIDQNDPDQNARKNIVVEVEREEGEVGPPTPAQQAALDALTKYLAERIQQDYPDTAEDGVNIDDSQGLLSNEAEKSIQPAPSASDYLPPETQEQVQDLNRLSDSGSGSMSPSQANDYFPQTDLPRAPEETDEIAAIKNLVAGFETKNSPEPYYEISDRGDPAEGGSGYGLGRFAFTGDTIINWIDCLSDEDLEAIEELEDQSPPGKNGKPAKGKLAKGTAARLRKIRALVHHKNRKSGDKLSDKDAAALENDPEVKEFTDLLRKAWMRGEKPTKAELDKNFDAELQEVIAGDLIHKYAVQSVDQSGNVNVGQIVLAMHLGHFPDAAELSRRENQDLMRASEQGYPLAVQSAAKPDESVTWTTDGSGIVTGDPNSYFISQFKSQFNPNNRDAKNLNCGPAALAMAIKHFGASYEGGNPEDPQALIEKTIQAMGYSGKLTQGTGVGDITRAAHAAGLQTDLVTGLDSVNQALAQNKQVIMFGNPSQSFAKQFNRANYVSPGRGDHWLLIAGRSADGGYIVNDPLSLTGAVTRSAEEISDYTYSANSSGLRGDGIAVWT